MDKKQTTSNKNTITITNDIEYKINFKLDTNINEKTLKFCIKSSDNIIDSIVDRNEYNRLMNAKNKIDEYYNIKKWDKIKKIINPYELIYITNKRNRKQSVSTYEPLSRSYYKMLEIGNLFLKDELNIKKTPKLVSCFLAEGPGGFVEGIINMRKCSKDLLYGITLIDKEKEVPGWKRIKKILDKNKNIKLLEGIDGTGNLYNTNNHKFVGDNIEKNCELVTADGGFDFSVDYNLQEFLALKLIFAEVICAMSIQDINGSFICKFFDINSLVSIQILYILSVYYGEVYIFKPVTSRPGNSEKYIICKKFKGISETRIKDLRNILNVWNLIEDNKKYVVSILDNFDTNFCKKITKINGYAIDEQIDSIENTIKVIKNPYTDNEYLENNKKQIRCSSLWCKKYEIGMCKN